ncbi:hypothetical protein R6Z07F_012691 [Ovis aries]
MLLELREKEKPRGLFCFTSDWHLTGCLPGRQAAPAFSGNAVNVYTGTARAQPLEPCWKLQPWFGGVQAMGQEIYRTQRSLRQRTGPVPTSKPTVAGMGCHGGWFPSLLPREPEGFKSAKHALAESLSLKKGSRSSRLFPETQDLRRLQVWSALWPGGGASPDADGRGGRGPLVPGGGP